MSVPLVPSTDVAKCCSTISPLASNIAGLACRDSAISGECLAAMSTISRLLAFMSLLVAQLSEASAISRVSGIRNLPSIDHSEQQQTEFPHSLK